MNGFRLIAALVVVTGIAMGATPQQLQFLPNGHVRLNGGPELDMPHFRYELRRLSGRRAHPEFELHIGKKSKYAAVAVVLADLQRAGFRIAFAVGYESAVAYKSN
jgi:biopolymer transport protein ExbD